MSFHCDSSNENYASFTCWDELTNWENLRSNGSGTGGKPGGGMPIPVENKNCNSGRWREWAQQHRKDSIHSFVTTLVESNTLSRHILTCTSPNNCIKFHITKKQHRWTDFANLVCMWMLCHESCKYVTGLHSSPPSTAVCPNQRRSVTYHSSVFFAVK